MKKGWEYRILDDVVKKSSSNISLNKIKDKEGGYPVYGAKGFVKNVSFYQQEKGYLAIIKDGAGIGRISKHPAKSSVLATMQYLIPKEGFNIDFIKYFLNGIDFEKYRNGSTIPHIYFKDYKTERFPILPLPEQKRIVKILDEVFKKTAKAKENAEKNLQNAREVFKSYLNNVFANKGDGWEIKTLNDVCKYVFAGGDVPKNNFSKIKTKKYSIPIFANGAADKGLYGYTDIEKVIKPSITVSARGTIGYSEIRNEPFYPVVRLIVLTPNTDVISLPFLKFVVGSMDFKNTGTSIPQLTVPMIKKYKSSIPPLTEQKIIVAKLDALSAETKKLEAIYKQKLTDLEELKKSVLQKAFNGELTAGAPIQLVSDAVEFPEKLTNINTTKLHAGILAMACQLHENKNKMEYFTHVKAEKIAHMIEAFAGIDLGRKPVKDAAGPNDFPHLIKVEHHARMTYCFDFKQTSGGAYRVRKLNGFEKLIEKTRTALGDRLIKVEHVLDLMLPFNVRHAEIVATVFAAWNNLLLDGKQPTDEDIVFEARENWHPDKLKIEREYFFKTIKWMKKKNIIPNGKGKRVVEKVA